MNECKERELWILGLGENVERGGANLQLLG